MTYDGVVNIGDFSLLALNFNLSIPNPVDRPSSMPESTIVAPALLFLLPARKRAGRMRRS